MSSVRKPTSSQLLRVLKIYLITVLESRGKKTLTKRSKTSLRTSKALIRTPNRAVGFGFKAAKRSMPPVIQMRI